MVYAAFFMPNTLHLYKFYFAVIHLQRSIDANCAVALLFNQTKFYTNITTSWFKFHYLINFCSFELHIS